MLVQYGLNERGGDLDSAISLQFTSETRSLSTLDPGPKDEASQGAVDSNGSGGVGLGKTGHCPRSAQPSTATKSGWQGNTPMPPSLVPGAAAEASAEAVMPTRDSCCPVTAIQPTMQIKSGSDVAGVGQAMPQRFPQLRLSDLPNEVLFHILSYLEVCDLLATSRVR